MQKIKKINYDKHYLPPKGTTLNDRKDWQSLMFFGIVIHTVEPTFENI